MEEWINLILLLIFGAVALFSRMLSRRNSRDEPDALPEEEEITLPPWGNVPMEGEEFPHPEFVEEEASTAPPEPSPAVQVIATPDPVEEEAPAQSSTDSARTIAGIPLSPQTFRQGIILAEILRPPKSLRQPPPVD